MLFVGYCMPSPGGRGRGGCPPNSVFVHDKYPATVITHHGPGPANVCVGCGAVRASCHRGDRLGCRHDVRGSDGCLELVAASCYHACLYQGGNGGQEAERDDGLVVIGPDVKMVVNSIAVEAGSDNAANGQQQQQRGNRSLPLYLPVLIRGRIIGQKDVDAHEEDQNVRN